MIIYENYIYIFIIYMIIIKTNTIIIIKTNGSKHS